jgi:hypothetical protein
MWSTNLQDTDKTMQAFFEGCADAGPEGCAFYAPSAANVSARLDSLLESIREQPIPVFAKPNYGIVDYSLLRASIFTALYQPYRLFAPLARALADLEAGDAVHIAEYLGQPQYTNQPDAGSAIICTDGDPVRDSTQEFASYYRNLSKLSSFAEVWGTIRLGCSYVVCCTVILLSTENFSSSLGDGGCRCPVVSEVCFRCAVGQLAP